MIIPMSVMSLAYDNLSNKVTMLAVLASFMPFASVTISFLGGAMCTISMCRVAMCRLAMAGISVSSAVGIAVARTGRFSGRVENFVKIERTVVFRSEKIGHRFRLEFQLAATDWAIEDADHESTVIFSCYSFVLFVIDEMLRKSISLCIFPFHDFHSFSLAAGIEVHAPDSIDV